jgi:hypothetical protein
MSGCHVIILSLSPPPPLSLSHFSPLWAGRPAGEKEVSRARRERRRSGGQRRGDK